MITHLMKESSRFDLENFFVILILLNIWWIRMWVEQKTRVIILLYIIGKKGLTQNYLDLY